MSLSKPPSASKFPVDKRFLWAFILILIAFFILFWGVRAWGSFLITRKTHKPFLYVTYRDFSNFLWQNPNYINLRNEPFLATYLPRYKDHPRRFADEIVLAPFDLIYQYHVWKRLLGNSLGKRPIYGSEFKEFLADNCEWQPENWPNAPEGYQDIIKQLPSLQDSDLQTQAMKALPLNVRMAFQGWKNYTQEWNAIRNMKIKRGELNSFLKKHPEYNRYYWRNILKDQIPYYLISFPQGSLKKIDRPDVFVSDQELSDFLRIGYYNYSIMTKPSG